MRRLFVAAPLLVCVCVAVQARQGQQPAQAPAGSQRSVFIIGDLHMGVGRDSSGAWDPYEDFRWGAEFGGFLKALDVEGKSAADLILNGDTFDLLQSRDRDCTYADAALGCTGPEALARLERALAAHKAEIQSLAEWTRTGSNRVVFVPGDHDAALLFPNVARRLLRAINAPEGRAQVATSGSWHSADGQIYAEHGHQMDFSASQFDDWPKPFVRRAGREHLLRPWGEQLVQPFYNQYETRYPIVDNFAEDGVGVKYALTADGASDVGQAAPRWLHFFLFKMSWSQFRGDLDTGQPQPPVWDLAKVRATGPAFLVAALPDDDLFKPFATRALNDGRLAASMAELTDVQLVAICDYRAAFRRARRRMEQVLTQVSSWGPVVSECPRTPETVGSAFENFWRSRTLFLTRRIEAVQRQVPRTGRPIAVFVHGHTHLFDRPDAIVRDDGGVFRSRTNDKIVLYGFVPVSNATAPVAINSGAWQRTITPVQLEELQTERKVSTPDLLRSLQPEQLRPCYTFLHIGPYAQTPNVQSGPYGDPPAPRLMRFWRQAQNGNWELAVSC